MIILKIEDVKYLLKVIIFIALFVIAIRFFIYMLPFIIIALIGVLIYDSYKKNKVNKENDSETKKSNKVIDATVLDEKENK